MQVTNEADATEREELNVLFPLAITKQNIKTELNEIFFLKYQVFSSVCGLYIDVFIFVSDQSGKETE